MSEWTDLVEALRLGETLGRDELRALIAPCSAEEREYLRACAQQMSHDVFGNQIYIRGLIEFTDYCTKDCYYCGIRRSNANASRYRLTKDRIMSCCATGYPLGFRTFVLQGGEDAYFDDKRLCDIVYSIKNEYTDCAVTLSVGERSRESYKQLRDAGADRYLLRHETADRCHFGMLHPDLNSNDNRKRCLYDLKDLGYQTGCGFMVGSPYQTPENIVDDLLFIRSFSPEMVGVGPFIPHRDTPFAKFPAGSGELTERILSIVRLLLPDVLLPTTTALGSLSSDGRMRGILAGANVVMPNLSPADAREKYSLYDNKIAFGAESAEGLALLEEELSNIGYTIVVDRGDYQFSG